MITKEAVVHAAEGDGAFLVEHVAVEQVQTPQVGFRDPIEDVIEYEQSNEISNEAGVQAAEGDGAFLVEHVAVEQVQNALLGLSLIHI